MNMMNQIVIEGNIHGIHETILNNGCKRISFTLKNVREFKWNSETKEEISHFNCDYYVKSEENIDLQENKRVRLVGKLKQSKWTDKDNLSKVKIVILVDFIDQK